MSVRKSKHKIVRAIIRERCCEMDCYPALRETYRTFINNRQRVCRHETATRHLSTVRASEVNLGIVDCFGRSIVIIETYRIYRTRHKFFRQKQHLRMRIIVEVIKRKILSGTCSRSYCDWHRLCHHLRQRQYRRQQQE